MEMFGTAFALKRYKKYDGAVSWKDHSKYKGFQLQRAYDGPQPKALYRAMTVDGLNAVVPVGEGLAQVKSAVTRFLEAKE